MADIDLNIDFKLLKHQMRELLDSNMEEESKSGLHELLGAIYDIKDELDEGYMEVGIISV